MVDTIALFKIEKRVGRLQNSKTYNPDLIKRITSKIIPHHCFIVLKTSAIF